MQLRNPAQRVTVAAGLAAGGVLAGHGLTYAVTTSDVLARDRLLAATGHGYLPAANLVAMVAVLITVGVLFLGRLTRPWGAPSWKQLGSKIAALQVCAFLAMEVFERLNSGAPLGGLLHGGLLLVGIGFQLLTAGVVTLLVRVLLSASDRLAAALGRAPRMPSAQSSVFRDSPFTYRARPDLLLSFSRGPPPAPSR